MLFWLSAILLTNHHGLEACWCTWFCFVNSFKKEIICGQKFVLQKLNVLLLQKNYTREKGGGKKNEKKERKTQKPNPTQIFDAGLMCFRLGNIKTRPDPLTPLKTTYSQDCQISNIDSCWLASMSGSYSWGPRDYSRMLAYHLLRESESEIFSL